NKHLYDNVEIPEIRQLTLFECYNFDKECQISSDEWALKTLQIGRKSFWFTVMGMINFAFLKNIKLKHYDYMILEDNLFGILLFMQVDKIYILPKQMYRNRIRPNSTMNHDKKVTDSNIPLFLKAVYYSFDKDPKQTKEYFRVASWVLLNNQMKLFLQSQHLSYYRFLLMREFVKYYFTLAKPILQYKVDPLNVSSTYLEVSNFIKDI
ncbi:TPA: hypothetical protein SG266_001637, partial [Campylobacter coli]|nr:hypothetical protein [Campylobacter coli]